MNSKDININKNGFREYDARWLYPKDINLEGIKNLGIGLGTQITNRTKKNPRVFMELVFSKWFGMNRPPLAPTELDIKKLKAIFLSVYLIVLV